MFAVLLSMCVMLAEYADAASFDQSQSGNLNVQVDLKDLHIIALMKGGKEEYVVSLSALDRYLLSRYLTYIYISSRSINIGIYYVLCTSH